MGWRRWLVGLGLLAVLGGGVAWWQRTPIRAWYVVRELCAANAEDRDAWVRQVVELDAAAVPGLLNSLTRPDQRACDNAVAALLALADQWGPDDDRSLYLIEEVCDRFSRFSPAGRISAIQAPIHVLAKGNGKASAPMSRAASEIMVAAADAGEPQLILPMLRLATALVERGVAGQPLDSCREVAVKHLVSADAEQRVAAIRLVSGLAIAEKDLLQRVLPFLRDGAGAVRRAALAALSRSRDLFADDDVLPLLHDADADVQRLAELTLRSRGLADNHVLLARQISDPDPAGRLGVLQSLQHAPDLDPGVWLRRLSEDRESAVRAAAIRAACQDFHLDFTDRLRHMAQSDPSETVRNIAQIYLRLSLARLEN